ncbi:hypothetical protein CDAR_223791 [Caerostris darwini]|uniref:Uncharacterized protein n=1 Tax=Caerostris darwini TaxID=1538125 RepID=A0AAV4S176_9ARAC|nr:hypothetical protein CDAR_223791 [Caerostris darwini]
MLTTLSARHHYNDAGDNLMRAPRRQDLSRCSRFPPKDLSLWISFTVKKLEEKKIAVALEKTHTRSFSTAPLEGKAIMKQKKTSTTKPFGSFQSFGLHLFLVNVSTLFSIEIPHKRSFPHSHGPAFCHELPLIKG